LSDPANDYVAQFVADVDRTRVLTAESVMERPRVTISANAGPRLALRSMREKQVSAAYVIERDRTLRGIVKDEAVVNAVRSDRNTITDLIEPDVVTVHRDQPLADVFAPAAESRLPTPVVDEDNRLVGVIPRVTLLTALADATNGNGNGLDPNSTENQIDVDDQTEEAASTIDTGVDPIPADSNDEEVGK
ncbi:MAG TPA: CBS domain-containing protein, partial [Actinomycetales bacterium]|nr:CBS domain-containing protein [Actinomycetales bacterium]